MDRIRIRGGRPLSGTIRIGGAKNAALALMPAALLTDETLTLTGLRLIWERNRVRNPVRNPERNPERKSHAQSD